jgi:hypothetical protein
MSNRFRYRRLSPHDDPQARAALRSQRRADALSALDLEGALVATGEGAPQRIEATEAEASAEALAQALLAGALSPNDLAFSRGAWTTFSQSPEFFEVCEPLVKRLEGRRTALLGCVALAVFALLLGSLFVALGQAAIRARLPW